MDCPKSGFGRRILRTTPSLLLWCALTLDTCLNSPLLASLLSSRFALHGLRAFEEKHMPNGSSTKSLLDAGPERPCLDRKQVKYPQALLRLFLDIV